MSAGRFTRSAYQRSGGGGTTHPIRVQPETIALVLAGEANAPSPDAIDSDIPARAGGGKRILGLIARQVTVQFAAGSQPDGYIPEGRISLPWLRAATFDGLVVGDSGLYLGQVVTLVGKSAERPV